MSMIKVILTDEDGILLDSFKVEQMERDSEKLPDENALAAAVRQTLELRYEVEDA